MPVILTTEPEMDAWMGGAMGRGGGASATAARRGADRGGSGEKQDE